MRPGYPNGGMPDQIVDLREEGFMSTSEMGRQLAIGAALPATFIINQLGVKPRVVLNGGNAMYWTPDQLRQVRRALVMRLLAAEFD